MSAAVREAIRSLDRWTVTLWLTAPRWAVPGGRRDGGWERQGPPAPHSGPMIGQVCCGEDPDSFLFLRPNRAAVVLRYEQVSMWREVAPPPKPLPVEEVPRP